MTLKCPVTKVHGNVASLGLEALIVDSKLPIWDSAGRDMRGNQRIHPLGSFQLRPGPPINPFCRVPRSGHTSARKAQGSGAETFVKLELELFFRCKQGRACKTLHKEVIEKPTEDSTSSPKLLVVGMWQTFCRNPCWFLRICTQSYLWNQAQSFFSSSRKHPFPLDD